jgi:hypothetical protein
MLRILQGFIIILILSCNKNTSKTYLGGGIVHPQSEYVLLVNGNQDVDSIKINKNGHFHHEFELEESGFFTLRHANEFQILYLEPKDSLRLRLNTMEFDESLVFSGKGAPENNFLIENFLLNQKNSDLILAYYKISPDDFQYKTDSIKLSRENKLNSIKEKYKLSEKFIDIAQKSIDYEIYDMRERYTFLLNKYNPKKAKNISEDFLEYRKNINFDDKSAMSLIVYRRFLDDHIKNLSIKICLDKNKDVNCYDLDSYTNLDDRIHLVDSLIKDDKLRKNYFERFIQEEIIYARTPDHISHTKRLIDSFEFSTDEKNKLNSLTEFQSALIVNADFKDVMIKCKDLRTHKLKDVLKSDHALVYSWSFQSPSHHKLRIEEVKQLKEKYPELQFIGINIDHEYPDKWLKAVNNYDYNYDNEFTIIAEKHSPFYTNYLNKVFFINSDCIVKKSEIVMPKHNLETHIQDYLSSVEN